MAPRLVGSRRGFLLQALALHRGQLSVVQPLLVTELIFALVLRRFWIHQGIRGLTWGAATLTSVSLALFLVAAQPHGGTDHPTNEAWVLAAISSAGVVAALAVSAQWGGAARRAALYGSAAAILWAFVATLIKAATDSFTKFGVSGMFSHWPVYALAASGLLAEIVNQAALHGGPLSVSQPFLVIVDPMVSIVLSVWVFGEHFSPNPGTLFLAAVSFVAMCLGVILLVRTAPTTMESTIRTASS